MRATAGARGATFAGMDGRTRCARAAIALTLLILAALPTLPASAEPGLRKVVSMGSFNHGGDYEDLTQYGNLDMVRATGARWVRIWVRWDKAQLFPPSRLPISQLASPANDLPGCGSGCGYRYVQAIDAQISAARAAGLNVILINWHFPRWSNGTEGKPADWARADRGSASTPVANLKAMEYGIPIGQLGRNGYYGRWLDWLVGRYAGYGRNLALEIMNEPNHQLWPQQAPSGTSDPFAQGTVTIGARVAEMLDTARAVAAARGNPILMVGPGMSDRYGADSRLMTNFQTAAPDVLSRLPSSGWADNFVWSHHNYSDVERNNVSPTRAEQARGYLVGAGAAVAAAPTRSSGSPRAVRGWARARPPTRRARPSSSASTGSA